MRCALSHEFGLLADEKVDDFLEVVFCVDLDELGGGDGVGALLVLDLAVGRHDDGEEHVEDDEEEEDDVGEEEDGGDGGGDELELVVVDRAEHHEEEAHEGELDGAEGGQVVAEDEVAHEDEAEEERDHHEEEVAEVGAALADRVEEDAEGGEDGVEDAQRADEHEADGERADEVVDVDGVGVGLPLGEGGLARERDVLRGREVHADEEDDRGRDEADDDDVDVVVPLERAALDFEGLLERVVDDEDQLHDLQHLEEDEERVHRQPQRVLLRPHRLARVVLVREADHLGPAREQPRVVRREALRVVQRRVRVQVVQDRREAVLDALGLADERLHLRQRRLELAALLAPRRVEEHVVPALVEEAALLRVVHAQHAALLLAPEGLARLRVDPVPHQRQTRPRELVLVLDVLGDAGREAHSRHVVELVEEVELPTLTRPLTSRPLRCTSCSYPRSPMAEKTASLFYPQCIHRSHL